MKKINNTYILGALLGESDKFRLYRCTTEAEPKKRTLIIKIASDVVWNADLDREAFLLEKLSLRAGVLEDEFAKVKDKPDTMLNYQISFPKLVESALNAKDGLRFNVLDLSNTCDDISELAAVSQFASREQVRIDAGTSVWVMGKLLKFLAFVHGAGISVRDLSSDNVLVHREHHYVLVFDFCSALLYPEGVPNGERCEDVSEAAKTVISFLGGDPDGGTIPPDKELTDSRYEDTLRDLASGTVGDALKAHGEFYELVDTIWKRSFRPFTTHPL